MSQQQCLDAGRWLDRHILTLSFVDGSPAATALRGLGRLYNLHIILCISKETLHVRSNS